jgi:Na+-driven multidrug efflux pump
MWCNVANAVTNAVLDWVFIFPLGMGVKGAAIATGISVVVGGVMAVAYLLFFARRLKPRMPKWSRKSLVLTMRNVWYQCRIGVSSLMGELSLAVFVFVGNLVFMRFLGDDGVGAFGISCYYTPFFFSVGNSIAQSAQPIISYNYGLERWDNVSRIRRMLLMTSFVVGAVVALLFVFVPEWLVGMFVDASSRAGVIAIAGFPYYALGIIFFILNVAIIGYYQSIERVGRAMFITALRGMIFIVPAFLILPSMLGVRGIWLAMPVAEVLTLAVVGIMLLTTKKRVAHTRG